MEFRLLGPVEVLDDGRALPMGGRRQRAVLAHLLLAHGTPVSSDWLVEQVWGQAAPAAARTSVHTYVSRLRAALGPDRVETRSDGYLLHACDAEVDAVRFDALLHEARGLAAADPEVAAARYDQALQLWHGPALGDLADEPALAAQAGHLDALRAATTQERIAVLLELGHHAQLVPELEELLEQEPLREDLWGQYVLALYRCDRQADALAALTRARTVLREELGVEPSERLQRLQSQVLQQDSALTLSGAGLHGYRLLEVLGQGTSGVVHRALQPHVGREVALKILRSPLSDEPAVVRRFESAAQAAMQLEHPNVVPLHDYWREPGGAFLVMRLMRGGSLLDRLEAEPPALSDLLRMARQLAEALEAVRRQGLPVRELRPEDVLLDEDGNAYVSGFSLERELVDTGATSVAGVATAAVLGRLLQCLLARVPDAPPAALDLVDRAVTAPDGFRDARELATALASSVSSSVPRQRRPEPRPVRNPYKGLRPFGEADAGDFFGRQAQVDRLVARMTRTTAGGGPRFLAVVGASGSGKSSLVRAGLVPALRAGAVPGSSSWYVADVVPGNDPFTELARALARVAVATLPSDPAAWLRDRPERLTEAVHALLPDDGGELLLLVDQFEELFTLAPDADRRAFLAALVHAATAADGRVRVVVVLRADFYDRPLSDPALARLVQLGTEAVMPLTAEEIEQAVVEPAARVGLRVEPALLAQVVNDVGEAGPALPLLQYALTELVDRRHGDVLTLEDYREVGGVAGALVRRADGLFHRLTPGQQQLARLLLLQLVQPGEDAATDTRRRVLEDELVLRTRDPDAARAVVTALGTARLLAFDRDPVTRLPTVAVAHEALLREWALLAGWVEAAREDLRADRRLTAAARDWADADCDPSFLATGARLDALQQWSGQVSAGSGWAPTRLQRDYLEQSVLLREDAGAQEQARRRRERLLQERAVRRLRVTAATLALAVVATAALTVFGFAQRELAREQSAVAETRALAATAVAGLDEDPERSLLLALEAVRRGRADGAPALPAAEDALHRALVASRLVLTVPGTGGAVDWSAHGLIVSEGLERSGSIDLRDSGTGASVRAFQGHDVDVNGVRFSPDGDRLLTTGDDGLARLWNTASGSLLVQLPGAGQVWGPSFSADGRRMAAAWQDEGVVRVVDVQSGAVVQEVRSVVRPWATALTEDGSRVVVAGRPVPGALVHDVATGAEVMRVGGEVPAFGVDVSPDGRRIATWGVDGGLQLWSPEDGSLQMSAPGSTPVAALAWSADSSRLVLGGADGVARVLEVGESGLQELLRITAEGLRGITGIAFSPDGGRVVVGATTSATTQVWDVGAHGSREWLTVPTPVGALGGADFTTDGRAVLVSTTQGRVAATAVADGRVIAITPAQDGVVHGVRTSPDGRLVAGFVAGAVRAWETATGAEVFAVPVSDGSALAWAPDGSRLAFTAEDGRLRAVDRNGSGVPLPDQPADEDVTSVVFVEDGRTVSVRRPADAGPSEPATVELSDRQGRVLRRLPPGSYQEVEADPGGQVVAVTTAAGPVLLWDTGKGQVRRTLVGHVGPAWDTAFSPDGRRLATAGQDGTVRLWDVSGSQEPLVLRGHTGIVSSVRFSPDGRRLVTASDDGSSRVWAVALDDLVQLAEARATQAG